MATAQPIGAAHGQVMRRPVAEVAARLQDVLGQRLAAVVVDVKDAKAVGRWARAEQRPYAATEQRLRDALLVVELLLQAESPETVRAWFRGMNPQLGDESPARALAARPTDVLQAARAFAADAW
jgi:hypothetical protein